LLNPKKNKQKMKMYIKLYLIILTLMNYGEEKNQLLVMN